MATKSRRGSATPQPTHVNQQMQPQVMLQQLSQPASAPPSHAPTPSPVPTLTPSTTPLPQQQQQQQQSQPQSQAQQQSQCPGSTSTPMPSAASRPVSPLTSPTRHSRLQEKADLQGLNDRLAAYIDRVRNLETDNARLSIEVHTIRDSITREANSIKGMYEMELADARRLLDETAREKAKLEIDIKRLWEENDELGIKYEKKAKECSAFSGNARILESRLAEMTAKYNTAVAERNKAVDGCNDMQDEYERMKKQYEETRKNLEDETLARVDLENSIQSLREELTFKDQIHSQEINETRSRRQVEISEIDGRLSEQYEMKLQQSLQELRDQYETQMRINRDDIELLYEQKIKNLQLAANRNSGVVANAMEEVRESRARIESLNGRITELEASNGKLVSRIRDLEQMLDNERARHEGEIHNNEMEIQRLRDQLSQQLQEYHDLMDIKVSLDLEIAAYDKLLCGEETRLNITPYSTNTTANTPNRSTRGGRLTPHRKTPMRAGTSLLAGSQKRKRTALDIDTEDFYADEFFLTSSAKGDIEIMEVDPDGKYVKIRNKGNGELSIGGWQLKRDADGKESSYKFNRNFKVDAGAIVTVWSSDISGIVHEPPSNIVMKSQKWLTGGTADGGNVKMVLLNGDGDEVAAMERQKRSVAKHRVLKSAQSKLDSGVLSSTHHSQLIVKQQALANESTEKRGEEKCGIM